MLKWLMRRGIAAFERKWQYDASYLHEIIDADPMAAWKFSRAAAIGSYRKDVPLAAWTAAAITAVRHEDRPELPADRRGGRAGGAEPARGSRAARMTIDPSASFEPHRPRLLGLA